MEFFRNHKSIFIVTIIVTVLVLGLVLLGIHFFEDYRVTTVYVEGNTHYSDMEIRSMVMDGFLGDNSLYLSLKYKNKSIDDIPFISKMEVIISDPNTIRVRVFEKATAGYVEYLEKYMYFDKDGVVIEASEEKTEGIPMVSGLSFDHVVIKEPLPVKDTAVFKSILTITQLVNKYNLSADRIYFGAENELSLYFKGVRVMLGEPIDLEEKIMKLQYMLPELENKRGILHMENYSDETLNVSFEPEKN